MPLEWPATFTPVTRTRGVRTTAEAHNISVVTRKGSMRVTHAFASRMNAAQHAAARSANMRPNTPTELAGPARSATPAAANKTQATSRTLRDPMMATVSGPKNSTATTIPTGAWLMAM